MQFKVIIRVPQRMHANHFQETVCYMYISAGTDDPAQSCADVQESYAFIVRISAIPEDVFS